MAFCPHCGKNVTDQASKCLACGKEFEPRAKSARLRGTMMMPSTGSKPQTPAAPPDPAPGPPAAAAVQPAMPVPAQVAPRAAGPSKVSKATMLGTGGMGLAPPFAPPGGRPTAAGVAPPPAAGVAPPPAAAPSAAPPVASQRPAAPEPYMPEPIAHGAASEPSSDPEDSQRFLVGDPMAPQGAPPRSSGRSSVRRSLDNINSLPPKQRTGALLGIGLIGMLLIATVGYFTARAMGLIQ